MILWWSATVWTTSPSASPPLSPLSPLSSSRPAPAATPSYLLWSCLAPFLNMVCVYTFPSGSEIFILMMTYCFSSFANCRQVGLLAQHFFEIWEKLSWHGAVWKKVTWQSSNWFVAKTIPCLHKLLLVTSYLRHVSIRVLAFWQFLKWNDSALQAIL